VSAPPFAPGDVVWFRGRRGRLVSYRDDRRAWISVDAHEGESIVPAAKLGRSRNESYVLASVAGGLTWGPQPTARQG
jgi:hypothetical protein